MTDQLTVGSLFSGIGGIDLGLERAGMRVAWQCELDPWCRRVLAKHWPDVPRYEDVRDLGADTPRVDVLAGGFPCQSVSLAGKRLAQTDERWLWPEFARLVRLLRPRYVLVENVPGLLAPLRARDRSGEGGGGPVVGPAPVAEVLGDLASCGFDAEWTSLGAVDVGAPHRRKRVWIVAYAQGGGGGTPGPTGTTEARADGRADGAGSGGGARTVPDAEQPRPSRAGSGSQPAGTLDGAQHDGGEARPRPAAGDVPDAGGEGIGAGGPVESGDSGRRAGAEPGRLGEVERAVVPPGDGSDRPARPESVRGPVADAARVRGGQPRVGAVAGGAGGGGAERLGTLSAEAVPDADGGGRDGVAGDEGRGSSGRGRAAPRGQEAGGVPDADDAGRVERRRTQSVPTEHGAAERGGEGGWPAVPVGGEPRPARPLSDAERNVRAGEPDATGRGARPGGRPVPDADGERRARLTPGDGADGGMDVEPGDDAAGSRLAGPGDRTRPAGSGAGGGGARPGELADTDGERQPRSGSWPEHAGREEPRDGGGGVPHADGPRPAHVRQGEARIFRQSWRDSAGDGGRAGWTTAEWWAAEPDVGRVAHGVPARVDRLRGLGNAVVPQVVEFVGRRIVEDAERC